MGTAVAHVILLFPLLLPAWKDGPLTNSDLVPGPYPIHVEEAKINFMQSGFEYVDYAMRARMIQNLGRSASPVAVDVLLRQLANETDERVQATILAQLANLPYDPAAILDVTVPLLEHSSTAIRFFAVNLYGALPDASAERLIEIATSDSELRVRRKAAARLQHHAAAVNIDALAELRRADDPVMRADAWAASCYAANAGVNGPLFVEGAQSDDPGVRYAVASHLHAVGLPGAAQAMKDLTADPHASVRGATAATVGLLKNGTLLSALLTLAGDEDNEVRRIAIENLAVFPVESAAVTVVGKFGDPAAFVREEAEETAVALHAEHPMADLTVKELRKSNPNIRFRAYNVLGRVGADVYRDAIAEAVRKERDPILIAAALKALYRLNDTEHEKLLLGFANHEADLVRENCALALGNLSSAQVMDTLKTLIGDDASAVREAALYAAGQIADPFFSPIFLMVLKSTGERSIYTSKHRSYACWGAGRIRPVDKQLAQRLVTQATTPVIPVMGMRMFEPDYVLASACFALAQCARDVPDILPLAEKVMAAHSKIPSREALRNQGPNDLLPSAELREAARQARAYLNGEEITQRPRPTRTISMIYRKLKD